LRKIIISLVVLTLCGLVFVGCQIATDAQDAYDLCYADQECRAEMMFVRNITTQATTSAVERKTSAFFADAIGLAVGSLIAYGFGVYKGRRVKNV
jgi:hypothetical protein